MEEVSLEYIEKYQKLYEKDPKSRVFAPLAEGYRRMGMLKEGLELAEEGVKQHPNFAGGRVALARLYADSQKLELAEKEFRKATELAPENLLAYQLLAETNLKLKKPKEALKAFKILLFLNPDNEKAKNAVKKLEALTADEYEDELFAMKPLKEAVKSWDELAIENDSDRPNLDTPEPITPKKDKFLDRILSLADAYLVRQDVDRAIEALNEAERLIGPHPEIIRRLKIVHQRQLEQMNYPKTAAEIKAMVAQPPPARAKNPLDERIEFLQDLLQRIKNRGI